MNASITPRPVSSPFSQGSFPVLLQGKKHKIVDGPFKGMDVIKFTDESVSKIREWWGLEDGLAQIGLDWYDDNTIREVATIFPQNPEYYDDVAKAAL